MKQFTNLFSILALIISTIAYAGMGPSSGGPSNVSVAIGTLPAANGGTSSSLDMINCSVAGSVAANALTIALKDGAGSDPSASSPCKIGFRNATASTGTYSVVSTSAALSVVVSNGSALGCTASVACVIYVYAINNAGSVVLGVIGRSMVDEGSVASSTAEGGAGAADSAHVIYSTAAQSSKAIRLLARILITPGASFAWSAGPTEISLMPAVLSSQWYIAAYFSGANPSLGSVDITSFTELSNSGLSLIPYAGSAPVGTMCSATNAATAPSTGTTTCAAGNESLGINFAIPEPGLYRVCFSAGVYERLNSGVRVQPTFQLVETPTNAQTISYGSTAQVGYVLAGMTIAGGVNQDSSVNIGDCAIFPWENVSPGTVKGVRMMYQQLVTGGTPSAEGVLCDAAAGRVCYWSVTKM